MTKRIITAQDIIDISPHEPLCTDPLKFCPDGVGTLLDILEPNDLLAYDRLWVALRERFMPPGLLRSFGIETTKKILQAEKNNLIGFQTCCFAQKILSNKFTKEEVKKYIDSNRLELRKTDGRKASIWCLNIDQEYFGKDHHGITGCAAMASVFYAREAKLDIEMILEDLKEAIKIWQL